MTQKLIFSVENAQMVNENPDSNFAVLSLDFFASGENFHGYVSEETLMRTAPTIKNCPIVWKYDDRLDDVYTHDKDEVPCGFVPESSEIKSRKLPDGRTMLSVIAYVWKRYTGELLSIFKRDGGKKPVSVEMSVYDTQSTPDGLLEFLDYKYEGITVLGSYVTPAIPLANATVLSFSEIRKEYDEAIQEEFSTTLPVRPRKQSITKTLKYATKKKVVLPQVSNTNPTEENNTGVEKNSDEMEKNMNDDKLQEMAVTPPAEEQVAETAPVVETMAAEKENPSEEKAPSGEEKPEEEKKFEFPKNFNMEMMEKMFAEEEEDEEEEVKMAKQEFPKKEFANPGIVMAGMFAKMCKMAAKLEKMKTYMEENMALKDFKASVEEQQKQFAVELTIKELSEIVVLPDDAKKEMISESEKYSLSNIEGWKTYCKAKSFEFARKEAGKSDVVRVGMPFAPTTQKKKDDLWAS